MDAGGFRILSFRVLGFRAGGWWVGSGLVVTHKLLVS